MLIEFFPKQLEAHNALWSNNFDFILYGGAVRGGKTIWGLSELLLMCEAFPGSRWCIIREDTEKLRTTTIPSFKKLQARGQLKQSPYEYVHHNGSIILFKSENFAGDKEMDWMKGLEVNGILFEEINECQQQTLFKAFERVGTWIIPGKIHPPSFVIATCNPTQGWVKKLVYTPNKEGKLKSKWLYVPSRVYDNIPFLEANPGYLDFQKNNLNHYEYEVFINGSWDVMLKTGGEFLKEFNPDIHVRPLSFNKDLPICVFVDKNYMPYIAVQIWQMEEKTLKMIDEIPCRPPNNSSEKAAIQLVKWAKDHNYQDVISIGGDYGITNHSTEDADNKSFLDIFSGEISKSFRRRSIVKPNPPVAASGGFINSILEGKVNGCQIIVNEKCKETINDWIVTKEKMDGTMIKEKETVNGQTYEKNGHFTDLGRYAAFTLLPQEFIKYQNRFSGSGRTMMGKNTHASSY